MLAYPGDAGLRPTMQRTKQSFFSSMLGALPGAVFVDCFAGAGGVGIEALSLGAGCVHFIEERRDAVLALRANLALACGFLARASVVWIALGATRAPSCVRRSYAD